MIDKVIKFDSTRLGSFTALTKYIANALLRITKNSTLCMQGGFIKHSLEDTSIMYN